MSRNVLILFIFFSICPQVALSAENSEELEEILVTASRTPVPANQIGSSFTIIDADQLANRQIAPLSEVLRGVPGLAVSRSGVLGSSTLRMGSNGVPCPGRLTAATCPKPR